MVKKQSPLHVVGVSVLMVLLCSVNYSLCEKIKTYKLTRGSLSVTFTNYGAVMTSLLLPDRHGLSLSSLLSHPFFLLIFLCFKSEFAFLMIQENKTMLFLDLILLMVTR
jgi:hypothetical protein